MQTIKEREQLRVEAGELVDAFKKLVHAGNVRRIVIRQDEHVIAEFPVTVGVVGAVLAPMLAMVGALAAFVSHCTLEIERDETIPSAEAGTGPKESGRSSSAELEDWQKY